MLFSIYPTDTPAVRDAVIEQVLRGTDDRLIFTSLHLPEHESLDQFGRFLESLHREHAITFCGDISPATLGRVGGMSGLRRLRDWGAAVLRIDYGFDSGDVLAIAEQSGCEIAVNASTATAETLDALGDLPVIGWHNFYPRPETALSERYYVEQNSLFRDRGLRTYTFIPGEVSTRAPLFVGLPTLEEHRHRNSWRVITHLRRIAGDTTLVCAEGTMTDQHLAWTEHLNRTGEVTVPLVGVEPAARFLLDRAWRLRGEDSEAAFRVEDTRGADAPTQIRNADRRSAGSMQMDLPSMGRYRGEIQIMRHDLPLTPMQARVADIAGPYVGIVNDLRPGATVRFVQYPA